MAMETKWVVWNPMGVFTLGGGNGNGKMHICLYLTQFLSVAIAITKWVQNPFTSDAVAVAFAAPSV